MSIDNAENRALRCRSCAQDDPLNHQIIEAMVVAKRVTLAIPTIPEIGTECFSSSGSAVKLGKR